jgi:hypothetical protein
MRSAALGLVVFPALTLAGWLLLPAAGIRAASQNERRVTLAGEQKQCALSSSIQVWRFSYDREARFAGPSESISITEPIEGGRTVGRAFVTFVDGGNMNESCRWTFSGLPDGEYVAFLLRPDGSGGAVRFALPNAETTISIPPPHVLLSGTVTRDGAPPGRVMFRVAPVRFSRPAIVVVTDPQGKFVVSLDEPGDYEASSANGANPRQAPWVRRLSLTAGENQTNLNIPN